MDHQIDVRKVYTHTECGCGYNERMYPCAELRLLADFLSVRQTAVVSAHLTGVFLLQFGGNALHGLACVAVNNSAVWIILLQIPFYEAELFFAAFHFSL